MMPETMEQVRTATAADPARPAPGPKNYRRLFRDEAQALSTIAPRAVALVIAKQWLAVFAVFAACILTAHQLIPLIRASGHPALAVLCAVALVAVFVVGGFVTACAQHALGVIMHDATHYRLFETKRYNDGVSDFLCAFPIGMVTASYRRGHLPHHAFTNKHLDPYWARLSGDGQYRFPMPARSLRRLLLKDATGMNLRSWWPILRAWTGWAFILRDPERFLSAKDRRRFTIFWAVVAAGSIVSGLWPYLLLLWLLPMMTFNLAFTRLRIIAEHDLDTSDHEITRTRHVDGTWLERFAIGPLNINYHIAHHLFPMVPLYNLPRMHAVLMRDPDFAGGAQLWPRYLGQGGIITSLLK